MLEDWLGDLSEVRWPAAFVLVAVAVVVGLWFVNDADNKAEIKRDAVQACEVRVEDEGGSLAACVKEILDEL